MESRISLGLGIQEIPLVEVMSQWRPSCGQGMGEGGVRCSKQQNHRCQGLEVRGNVVGLGAWMELLLLGLPTEVRTCVHIYYE